MLPWDLSAKRKNSNKCSIYIYWSTESFYIQLLEHSSDHTHICNRCVISSKLSDAHSPHMHSKPSIPRYFLCLEHPERCLRRISHKNTLALTMKNRCRWNRSLEPPVGDIFCLGPRAVARKNIPWELAVSHARAMYDHIIHMAGSASLCIIILTL